MLIRSGKLANTITSFSGAIFFLSMIQGGSITCRIFGPECRRILVRPARPRRHYICGHSLVMWSAVCLSAPYSHQADGASPIWFMLCLNLPYPVLIRSGRTIERRLSSCPTGFFGRIWINSLSRCGVPPSRPRLVCSCGPTLPGSVADDTPGVLREGVTR